MQKHTHHSSANGGANRRVIRRVQPASVEATQQSTPINREASSRRTVNFSFLWSWIPTIMGVFKNVKGFKLPGRFNTPVMRMIVIATPIFLILIAAMTYFGGTTSQPAATPAPAPSAQLQAPPPFPKTGDNAFATSAPVEPANNTMASPFCQDPTSHQPIGSCKAYAEKVKTTTTATCGRNPKEDNSYLTLRAGPGKGYDEVNPGKGIPAGGTEIFVFALAPDSSGTFWRVFISNLDGTIAGWADKECISPIAPPL